MASEFESHRQDFKDQGVLVKYLTFTFHWLVIDHMVPLSYWVGQNVHLGFSTPSYRKTQMKFWRTQYKAGWETQAFHLMRKNVR